MFTHKLRSIVYPADGSQWFVETTRNPLWQDIEAAIRRLDREAYPFIHLFRNSDTSDDAVPDFTVMGGRNAYVFGPEDKLFYDETRSDAEVHIWLSDQGASFPERQVCHDLAVVLRATRLFAEAGQLDTVLTWRTMG